MGAPLECVPLPGPTAAPNREAGPGLAPQFPFPTPASCDFRVIHGTNIREGRASGLWTRGTRGDLSFSGQSRTPGVAPVGENHELGFSGAGLTHRRAIWSLSTVRSNSWAQNPSTIRCDPNHQPQLNQALSLEPCPGPPPQALHLAGLLEGGFEKSLSDVEKK